MNAGVNRVADRPLAASRAHNGLVRDPRTVSDRPSDRVVSHAQVGDPNPNTPRMNRSSVAHRSHVRLPQMWASTHAGPGASTSGELVSEAAL